MSILRLYPDWKSPSASPFHTLPTPWACALYLQAVFVGLSGQVPEYGQSMVQSPGNADCG